MIVSDPTPAMIGSSRREKTDGELALDYQSTRSTQGPEMVASSRRTTMGGEPVSGYHSAVPAYRHEMPTPPRPPVYDPVINLEKGHDQGPKFQDVWAAILFFGMIASQIVTTSLYAPDVLSAELGDENSKTAGAMVGGLVLMSGLATALSVGSLWFMMACAESLISACLIGSVITNFVMAVVFLAAGSPWAILWVAMAFIGVCYAYFVWNRIAFASANLKVALTAVKANMSLVLIAALSLFVAFLWSLWGLLNFLAIAWHLKGGEGGGDGEGDEQSFQTMNGGILFLLLVGFYWGHQVIAAVVRCTVAGSVGSWVFTPGDIAPVKGSLKRALTYSFGSICFGSLIVALIQATRAICESARQSAAADGDSTLLLCVVDCILGCIEAIAEYITRWAYVYVGLYGYGFLDAGKSVMSIFKARGFTFLINDDLIANVLTFASAAIGAVTGGIGVLIYVSSGQYGGGGGGGGDDEDGDGSGGGTRLTAIFIIGFLVGMLFASTVLSIVLSAVDTILVCWAEAPLDLQQNHPEHYDAMHDAWQKVYPLVWRMGQGQGQGQGQGNDNSSGVGPRRFMDHV